MRKVARGMSVSVDGCVGGPNGEVDWIVKRALELFDSGVTELYPHTHGCLLLWRCWVRVRGEIHSWAYGSQPQIPNFFAEEL